MSALLEVRDVSKRFGGVVANRALSLEIAPGAITGLIGPNGSGKTTLFNSIVGRHPIDGGSIRFDGREISRLRTPQIARLGLIRTFQQTHVYRAMDCVQNMQISTPHAGETLRAMLRRPAPAVTDRAEALLEFVGLHSKRRLRAGELSFGQQKLLELAMALMSAPRLLLLDEPTAGLDPDRSESFVRLINSLHRQLGLTVVLVTHDLDTLAGMATRVAVLAEQRILALGTIDEITRVDHPFIRNFFCCDRAQRALQSRMTEEHA